MLEQERCDFTYILKDPDGGGEDQPITSCTDTFAYVSSESSGGCRDEGSSPQPLLSLLTYANVSVQDVIG